MSAILAGGPIVADVEMICVGVSKLRLAHFGVETHQFIGDRDVIERAQAENSIRAVQAVRKARELDLPDGKDVVRKGMTEEVDRCVEAYEQDGQGGSLGLLGRYRCLRHGRCYL